MLVGVADNVSELIEAHPSTQRCITQVLLPLMKPSELAEIIDSGFNRLGFSLEDEVKSSIINLSQGFPYYTHSLCKHLSINSIMVAQHHKSSVDEIHIDPDLLVLAVNDAVSDTFETVKNAYRDAVASAKPENKFKPVLLAAAMTDGDEYHMFRQVDLVEPLTLIEGKAVKPQHYAYHLSKLCEEDRGCVLRKTGTKNNYKYSFRDPMVRSFVLMKAYQDRHPSLKEFILGYES